MTYAWQHGSIFWEIWRELGHKTTTGNKEKIYPILGKNIPIIITLFSNCCICMYITQNSSQVIGAVFIIRLTGYAANDHFLEISRT